MSEEIKNAELFKKLGLEELKDVAGGRDPRNDDQLRKIIKWVKDCHFSMSDTAWWCKTWGMSLSEQELKRVEELWDSVQA